MSCECVQRHVPLPTKYYEVAVDGGEIQVCPTTFFNVQSLLSHYQVYGTIPPGSIRKHYSHFVQELCLSLYIENGPESMVN